MAKMNKGTRIIIGISTLLAIFIAYGIYHVMSPGPPIVSQSSEPVNTSVSKAGDRSNPGLEKKETGTPATLSSTDDTASANPLIPASIDERLGYASKYGGLPDSLAGVEVPNGLRTDDEGNLVISMEIRNVFEFFIAGSSEDSWDVACGRVREFVANKLPPLAAEEANRIFDNYLAYKADLDEHRVSATVPPQEALANLSEEDRLAMVTNALQYRKDARRRFMDPVVVDAFFGDEEAYDAYSLQLIELNRDTELVPEEKESRLEDMEAQLPAHMREWRRKERIEKKIESEILELSKQGGNEEEINRLRTEAYGPEAAARLAKRDKEREWSRRLMQYRKVVGEISSNPELSDEERQNQIGQYRKSEFSDDELERLDRVAGQSAVPGEKPE